MLTCMVLLQLRSPAVVQMSGAVVILQETLDILDNYNRLAPGLGRDDKEDLSWPGVWSKYQSVCPSNLVLHNCHIFKYLIFSTKRIKMVTQ